MNTPEPEPDTRNTRPQGLVLGLLGQFVLDRAEEPVIPTQAFLAVLGALGVSEAATRATLNRMAHRDLLTRHKQGRSTAFGLTPDARTLAGQGRDRIFAATPFDHPEGNWTVLSCPLPESLRNARYQLQTRLSWAGFGPLRGNLWIAPGHIDVEAMLAEVLPAEELDSLEAFYATPAAPSRTEHLILKAWDLDALRAAHDTFLNRWEDASPPRKRHCPNSSCSWTTGATCCAPTRASPPHTSAPTGPPTARPPPSSGSIHCCFRWQTTGTTTFCAGPSRPCRLDHPISGRRREGSRATEGRQHTCPGPRLQAQTHQRAPRGPGWWPHPERGSSADNGHK